MDSRVNFVKAGCILSNINSYPKKDGSGMNDTLTLVCGRSIFEGTRAFEREKLPPFDKNTGEVIGDVGTYTVSVSVTVGRFSRIEILDICPEKEKGGK